MMSDSAGADPCPHDSYSGDEGPVALLGRMPTRWRCDGCGYVKHDDPCLCSACDKGGPERAERPYRQGNRVYVTDPALAHLRSLMASFGEVAYPNHFGTVEENWEGGDVLIHFDDGGGALYPEAEIRHLTPEEEARWPKRPDSGGDERG